MKKLSLVKVLGVFSVFYSSDISFAGPVSKVSEAVSSLSQAMSSLIGNVDQQHVDAFDIKVQIFIERLQAKLGSNKKEEIEFTIAYFTDLIAITKKVLQYQQNQTQQLRNELEAIARTYGGDVYELIWSVIHPAPAPGVIHPPAPAAVGAHPPPPPGQGHPPRALSV